MGALFAAWSWMISTLGVSPIERERMRPRGSILGVEVKAQMGWFPCGVQYAGR
jgi:hypothetical protein